MELNIRTTNYKVIDSTQGVELKLTNMTQSDIDYLCSQLKDNIYFINKLEEETHCRLSPL